MLRNFLNQKYHLYNKSNRKLSCCSIVPREARAEGPSVARLINLSGRAGPSGAKPREFERKIYLLRSTKENASLISSLRPVSFELVCLCTAMQNFSRLL